MLLAGLTTNHQHHDQARPHVVSAREGRIAGPVLAETFARLRGYPFNLDVDAAATLLSPWRAEERLIATPSAAYVQALEEARTHNLGGNVHDLLIVLTYQHVSSVLVTFDRRQAALARQTATEVVLLRD